MLGTKDAINDALSDFQVKVACPFNTTGKLEIQLDCHGKDGAVIKGQSVSVLAGKSVPISGTGWHSIIDETITRDFVSNSTLTYKSKLLDITTGEPVGDASIETSYMHYNCPTE